MHNISVNTKLYSALHDNNQVKMSCGNGTFLNFTVSIFLPSFKTTLSFFKKKTFQIKNYFLMVGRIIMKESGNYYTRQLTF